jgi:hypothetical protein
MSGWVASRVLAESASRQVFVDGAPGFISGIAGFTLPGNIAMPTPGIGFGESLPGGFTTARAAKGSGVPVGMGPVRLEMSLKERLAALAARREERDKRFMALRRYYVAQLKNFHLESKVRQHSA